MNKLWLLFPCLLALAACQGAHQQAGERQDAAAANAAGVDYAGSGPAERMGKVQDRADASARKAREASAEALDAQAKNYQRQADIKAESLKQQANDVRNRP